MMINNTSTGTTLGQSQRSLQTADELRTMKKGTILFVNASSPAAMLQTIGYFEDRKLAKLADLPFELDFPLQPPIVLVDPSPDQGDQEVTEPEIEVVSVVKSLPINAQGSGAGEEQEPEELEVDIELDEEELEPIGLRLEEEATTSQVHDTEIAPEE
jgi:hypothetical protein